MFTDGKITEIFCLADDFCRNGYDTIESGLILDLEISDSSGVQSVPLFN